MRYCDSIFGHLLKPIDRRWFEALVDRHGSNAYDKSFKSWDHLVFLIFAQLSGIEGLRGLEGVWNANAHHHYHLGVGEVARTTVSDANARRPAAIFSETFAKLSALASRSLRKEGDAMLRLIDSTPIPLGELFDWAKGNGRIRGLKLHTVYDPLADNPTKIEITHANVNDIQIGEAFPLEAGITYVFDKAYCKYPWWTAISDAGAIFVTRKKTSSRFRAFCRRPLRKRKADGFIVLEDAEVKLVSKGDSKLAIPMRRISIKRDEGGKITLLTNDMQRSALEIAALYKMRWQIELLFRWIKQHLKLKRFLGRNENAIRLQVIAAMIAYLLLRLVVRGSRLKMPVIRLADLLTARIFMRADIHDIDKPPQIHPSKARPKANPGQMELSLG
jgi:putative transposase